MNDAPHEQPEAAAELPPPRVRMDRSRSYSTIHGERGPDDKHAGVCFYQDGLPVDAEGFFIFDHPDLAEKGPIGDKRRATAIRKLEKARKQQAKESPRPARAEGADGEDAEDEAVDDDEENDDDLLEPINLEAWLRGEQEVEWQEITQEIARRFKKRISKVDDAIPFLCKEIPFPKGSLRRKFQKYAD